MVSLMLRMKCAIEHRGCWATNLGKSPYVKDLKFWSGLMLDPTRIMGSFLVRTTRPIHVTEYNQYPLDYINVERETVGDDELYSVDYVVRDPARKATINLLFSSGCVFDPPATVDGDYEIHNVLASSRKDLRTLERTLRQNRRSFRILSLKEVPSADRTPVAVLTKGLTPRQHEAVRVAFRRGFYNYPRRTRIADLAQEVGLSRSTFQEHLRLAEVKLIRYLLETEEHEDLLSA
jgi:predicted DNA binding protein